MSDDLSGIRDIGDGHYVGNINDDEFWTPIEAFGTRWSRFLLGEPGDRRAPMVWMVEVPPGFTVERHYHEVHRLELILEGGYVEAGEDKGPGTLTFFKAGVEYGPLHFENGGRYIEIFSESEDYGPIFETMPDDAMKQNLINIGLSPRVKS